MNRRTRRLPQLPWERSRGDGAHPSPRHSSRFTAPPLTFTQRERPPAHGHVRQSPHRQPRRHRLPHHPHAEEARHRVGGGLLRSRSRIPCTWRRRTRRCASGRRRRRKAICAARGSSKSRARPGRRRSIRATASCRRTPISPKPAQRAGIAFIGPTPEQMRAFGLKHTARELAAAATACRCCRASGLLADVGQARAEAARIGYPVMLKSTAGGGGIGMRLIWSEGELAEAFAAVERLARANFKDAGIYLEKYVEQARHIEVQIFGDGRGKVIALGERDCSVQRRNQKVIEETPAPNLSDAARAQSARNRGAAGAGGRLSLGGHRGVRARCGDRRVLFPGSEHAAAGRARRDRGSHRRRSGRMDGATGAPATCRRSMRSSRVPRGASIQVRLYAEDPAQEFPAVQRPAHGGRRFRAMRASRPGSSAAVEVPPYYDPMIAKIIVRARNRARRVAEACATRLSDTRARRHRDQSRVPAPGRGRRDVRARPRDHAACSATSHYRAARHRRPRARRADQRAGLAGPRSATGTSACRRRDRWIALALRLANRLLGNPARCGGAGVHGRGADAALQLRHVHRALRRADAAELDGKPLALWRAHQVEARQRAEARSACRARGCAPISPCRGGFDVPDYLGAKATFTLGRFGGHAGRTLARRRRAALCRDGAAAEPADARCRAALHPALLEATGRSACCTARTARRTSSRRTTSTSSSPPTGRCTTTPAAPACA